MNNKKIVKKIVNILLPFVLGGGILYWMYRNTDFASIEEALLYDMDWSWMMFSMVFGVLAQVFRGLRWKQSLEPLGENASVKDCIHAVFISYASSLVIPRSGEFSRCGVLAKYDGVNFSKALGTVVTERIIDSSLVLLITSMVFLFQVHVFNLFFDKTGAGVSGVLKGFTPMGYFVTFLCLSATIFFLWYFLSKFAFMSRLRQMVGNVKEGVMSLSVVRHKWLYAFYSVMIWVSYFLHYWITFQCFDFSAELSFDVAAVSFVVGSISVIVPTPNGAGPWHFAVKTILVLYGVADCSAEVFVLIVHTLQTALVPLLGVFSLFCLSVRRVRSEA